MRVPVSLPFVVGIITLVLFTVLIAHSDGKAVEKSELTKKESNVITKPSLFGLFRSLIPAKAIATLASAASSMPQARSMNGAKQQAKKKPVKPTGTIKKAKSTDPVKKTTSRATTRVPKSRQNDRSSGTFGGVKTPVASEMEVLTHGQKRDRLRQALVDETQDNCLAKILCGVRPSQPQPPKNKVKDPNLATETAYLIKEFFNIFDISDDDVKIEEKPTDDKQKEKEVDKEQSDVTDDKESEEDDDDDDEEAADDEVDDILRATPVTESPSQLKKYATSKPTKPTEKTRTSKPMGSFVDNNKKNVAPTPTVAAAAADVGVSKVSIDKKEDKNGVTPSTEVITTTMISTSMKGSATLKPLDMPFEIPLKTAKDDAEDDDDDEEEDNHKYDEDEQEDSKHHRVTLEELVGDIKLSPGDFQMMSSRGGRSLKLSLDNVTPNKYIQSKIRQMRMADSETKKLRIAGQVASSFRQPRQCRQFSQVAQEVLQTCPLTTEVIRFFNTNLRNGTQLEIKKIPQGSNSTGGGLVVLNNDVDGAKQAYFVDNSPQVANTKITTDLKNPSVPTNFNEDEVQYPIYEKKPHPKPQNSNLNQYGQDIRKRPQPQAQTKEKEPSKEDSDEEQDDDPESEEEQNDKESEEADEGSEEDDGSEETDDDNEDEEEDDENSNDSEKSTRRRPTHKPKEKIDHEQIQGSDTNQPNVKVVIRPKKPPRQPPQPPTLPPGIIRVYGVPQPSFDKDFSQVEIGSRPVIVFGEEDIDRPAYKRRRQLAFRSSLSGKSDDDEEENVPFSSRNPKHPPLETVENFVNDGDDDDDDEGKTPYQTQKKNNNLKGKPLGGVKGADEDDDDDDDDDDKKKNTATKKGNSKNKDNDKDDQSVEAANNPPFVPSMMYNSGVVSQSPHYPHNNYYQQQPVPRPRYRPLVRPIQIMPDTNIPMNGINFRASPGREYMRPGRLYPLYHGKK